MHACSKLCSCMRTCFMLYKYIYTIAIGGNTDSDLNFQIQIVLQSPTISYHLSKIEKYHTAICKPCIYWQIFVTCIYIKFSICDWICENRPYCHFSISRNTDLKY